MIVPTKSGERRANGPAHGIGNGVRMHRKPTPHRSAFRLMSAGVDR